MYYLCGMITVSNIQDKTGDVRQQTFLQLPDDAGCRPPAGLRLTGCSVSQRCTEQNWKDYKADLICSSVGFQGDPVVSFSDKSSAESFRWIHSATRSLKWKRKFRIRFSSGAACNRSKTKHLQRFLSYEVTLK